MEELKPCPFCGGKAEFIVGISDSSHPENDFGIIQCQECFAQSASHRRAKAIVEWNHRIRQDNKPLTLTELKSNQGNPLYYKSIGKETPFDKEPHWFICDLNNLPDNWYLYNETWIAYKYKI